MLVLVPPAAVDVYSPAAPGASARPRCGCGEYVCGEYGWGEYALALRCVSARNPCDAGRDVGRACAGACGENGRCGNATDTAEGGPWGESESGGSQ